MVGSALVPTRDDEMSERVASRIGSEEMGEKRLLDLLQHSCRIILGLPNCVCWRGRGGSLHHRRGDRGTSVYPGELPIVNGVGY